VYQYDAAANKYSASVVVVNSTADINRNTTALLISSYTASRT